MKQTFVKESREILQRCRLHLAALKSETNRAMVVQSLQILADNLCEPALMVGMPTVFEVAVQWRQLVCALDPDHITPAILQRLGHLCHVLDRILTTDLNGSLLSAHDILAHDLKSPLSLIKTTAENLLVHAQPESAGGLQRILRQADKGLQLIAHWLHDAAQLKAGEQKEKIFVLHFLQECCDSWLEMVATKRMQLQLQVEEALRVHGHALYLAQIVHNLVGNAIKFSPPGSRIAIHAKKSRLPGRDVEAVLFEVTDQGRGIDAEQLPFLFLKRTQAEAQDRAQGSGLGLAICKSLCEWHGGTIWARSLPHQGSTFSFVIPDG